MADLAAALLLGTSLIGLVFWYFYTKDRSRWDTPAGSEGGAPDSSREAPPDSAGGAGTPAGQDAGAPESGRIRGDNGSARTGPRPPTPAAPPNPRSAPTNTRRPPPGNYDDEVDEKEEDDDLTLITLTPPEVLQMPITRPSTPSYGDEDEDKDRDDDPLDHEEPSAVPIIYDDDAAIDEPTSSSPLLLISAVGQTDLGQKRRKNEDYYLCMDDHHLFAVADGMGGHKGGEIASRLAVETIQKAFESYTWSEPPYPDVPLRGSELAIAIQRANKAVHDAAQADRSLMGMGTTVVSARFSPNKMRLYVGHVGDSRCYRLRDGELKQLTTDHTMGAAGITGPMANHLVRAIGVAPAVKIDLIIARPRPGDVYLLCSDGLSKMASDDSVREILLAKPDPEKASQALIELANEGGGRDNITVILVRVSDPKDLAQVVKRPS
jgi:protein phosphatase